jgi:NAD(P)-dependent dehydrogenase (short-subunit alcohol dehydrogenase family)
MARARAKPVHRQAPRRHRLRDLRAARAQHRQPGRQHSMQPAVEGNAEGYKAAGKLAGKVAIVTGGDSGIGRAAAIAFAKEGADVAIIYLDERRDAEETVRLIEETGRNALAISGDVGDEKFCRRAVRDVVSQFNRLDIVVNNAAEQHPLDEIEAISAKQLEQTFRTNLFAYFYLTQAALPHLKPGAAIVNSTSVTAFRGSKHLVDYASTKGAILAFTRSLAQQLVDKGIRVNAVAPGPVWTPLIPASFRGKQLKEFGKQVPMKRPGQPDEIAPSYVFLASDDSSYMTGQTLHPNGGEIVNA